MPESIPNQRSEQKFSICTKGLPTDSSVESRVSDSECTDEISMIDSGTSFAEIKSEQLDCSNLEIVVEQLSSNNVDGSSSEGEKCIDTVGDVLSEVDKRIDTVGDVLSEVDKRIDTVNNGVNKNVEVKIVNQDNGNGLPLKAGKKRRNRHKRRPRRYRCKTEGLVVKKKEPEEDIPPYQGFVGVFAAEICEMIFLLLSPKDLVSCSMVCKSWRDAVNSDVIWRRHCKQQGWASKLMNWTQFQRSSYIWAEVLYTSNANETTLFPLCMQRVCFTKYCFLQKNWRERKFLTYRFDTFRYPNLSVINQPTKVQCDGKYVVFFDNSIKMLSVWSLEAEPHQVLCDSCEKMNVSDIAICSDTIAIVQEPYISVFINKECMFKRAYVKSEFEKGVLDLRSKIFIKMNDDYLIGYSDCMHFSSYVWSRASGDLVTTISFDLKYPLLTTINLYGSSVYFGQSSNDNHKVVEFNLKQNCWCGFNITCPKKVKELLINEDFICAVTLENDQREFNNEVLVWNRHTGMIVKSFKTCGKSYQIMNNYLLYYYNAKLMLHSFEENNIYEEICVNDCISGVKPVFNHMLVVNTGYKVEVWDWIIKKKLFTAYRSRMDLIWVDWEKVILHSYRTNEIVVLRF